MACCGPSFTFSCSLVFGTRSGWKSAGSHSPLSHSGQKALAWRRRPRLWELAFLSKLGSRRVSHLDMLEAPTGRRKPACRGSWHARSSRQDCLAPLGRSRFLWAADGTRGRVDDISASPNSARFRVKNRRSSRSHAELYNYLARNLQPANIIVAPKQRAKTASRRGCL